MSIIEQAAKRLEQLRNAGVDSSQLPDTDRIPAAEDRRSVDDHPHVPEAIIQALESELVSKPAQTRPVRASPNRASPNDSAIARGLAVDRAPARRVDIDLDRLRQTGYVTPDAPRTQIADEFRVIKRPLLDNAQGRSAAPIRNANLIMITSALPGEGKTFVAINLAMSIAMEVDRTVLLVEADIDNPSILRDLGVAPTKGLMDVLNNSSLDLGDVLLRTNVEKLTLLPAGAAHRRSTELLASEMMAQLVEEMATRYSDRVIIFDGPPLLPTTESRVLATLMGQVAVVVEADRTTQGELRQALNTIETCPVVMTILNKAPSSDLGSYYGYRSYGTPV